MLENSLKYFSVDDMLGLVCALFALVFFVVYYSIHVLFLYSIFFCNDTPHTQAGRCPSFFYSSRASVTPPTPLYTHVHTWTDTRTHPCYSKTQWCLKSKRDKSIIGADDRWLIEFRIHGLVIRRLNGLSFIDLTSQFFFNMAANGQTNKKLKKSCWKSIGNLINYEIVYCTSLTMFSVNFIK